MASYMAKVYANLIRNGKKKIEEVPEKIRAEVEELLNAQAAALLLLRKEVETMAIIYATLIVKGKKTYAQVPEKIKPQVKQVLIDLECEDLITEE